MNYCQQNYSQKTKLGRSDSWGGGGVSLLENKHIFMGLTLGKTPSEEIIKTFMFLARGGEI